MGIVFRLFDKILFAVLFITMLQVPVVADHYLQYLNGYLDATDTEVSHYQTLASKYGYSDANAMIEALTRNPDPLVKDDAQHKQLVIDANQEAHEAFATLSRSNYFEQAWYFAQPFQYERLQNVLAVYQPSLPLHLPAISSALVTSLCLYLGLSAPVFMVRRRRRRQQHFSNNY